MVSRTTIRHRLPRWFLAGVLGIVLACESATLAQERSLEAVVQADLALDVSHTYVFRAGAGDVLSGTFELRGAATGIMSVHDETGSKLDESRLRGPGRRPIGFIVPAKGVYRIRITAVTAPASYTLSTKKQTPAERVAGVVAMPAGRSVHQWP